MKKIFFGKATIVVAMLISWGARAQVANGDFNGSVALWDWSRKTVQVSTFEGCDKGAAYTPFAPTSASTPSAGSFPAAGKVALVTPPATYSKGSHRLCGRVEQTVHVPSGTKLKFVAKIGDVVGAAHTPRVLQDGFLDVRITDASTNVMSKVLMVRGRSAECPRSNPTCVSFVSYTVDMSPYWNKTVRLSFQGESRVDNDMYGMYGWAAPVYVDNVMFQ